MKLYGYFRSSAAYRARIALNIKGLEYDYVPINLRKNEQDSEMWRAMNPQGLIPLLETARGDRITQSLAIIEWLEENYPHPALLPGDSIQRSRIRAMACEIACDIHPLNNLRVLQYLENTLEVSDEKKLQWYRHWINKGFFAIESRIESSKFCFDGNEPTMADVYLIPQVANGLRFGVDISAFPHIESVYEYCTSLPAFVRAAPENQPDAI